jgi:hypothetical protein
MGFAQAGPDQNNFSNGLWRCDQPAQIPRLKERCPSRFSTDVVGRDCAELEAS